MFLKMALHVSSVSPRTRATNSLPSSRAPGVVGGGAARSVGADGDSPPWSEIRTSSGFSPRNPADRQYRDQSHPPSLRPPPKPPAGPAASRFSTLPLSRMFPQRTVSPPCPLPCKACAQSKSAGSAVDLPPAPRRLADGLLG